MRNRSSRTGGQALTEFILLFPLFFVLLLGVVQFSLLYCAFQVVQYASFASVRAAAVRPCTAFNPDDSGGAYFTTAVFTAATLSTMALAPPQPLLGIEVPFAWMPALPDTAQIHGLDYRLVDGNIPDYKYINAAYLTSVQRVRWDETGSAWLPLSRGLDPGFPLTCASAVAQQQNVPPAGSDVTLEVTFLYPMSVPLVNRVIYGIFVNFSSMAQNAGHPRYLGLDSVLGSGDRPEDEVMVLPTRVLPSPGQYASSMRQAVESVLLEFGYSDESIGRADGLVAELEDRAWYPLPIRARCTLTVEGSPYPLIGSP